jgi:hypothetical protein
MSENGASGPKRDLRLIIANGMTKYSCTCGVSLFAPLYSGIKSKRRHAADLCARHFGSHVVLSIPPRNEITAITLSVIDLRHAARPGLRLAGGFCELFGHPQLPQQQQHLVSSYGCSARHSAGPTDALRRINRYVN